MRKTFVAYASTLSCAVALGGLFSASCAQGGSAPLSSEPPAKAILTIPASSDARAELGVSGWTLDLGQQGLVVTGIDGSGNAVRGLLLAFTDAKLPGQMIVEMLDGTQRAQILTLGADGTGSVDGNLTEGQGRFVGQALVDIGSYEATQGQTHGASLDPGVASGGLHALGGGSQDCGQQYSHDAYNIAVGGLGCASLVYSGGGSSVVRAVGWAAQAKGRLGAGIHLPNCADAVGSFFDLGTCGSNSCFQVQSACPSCGADTHLEISFSTGVGTCAPGANKPAQMNGCAPGETRLPGVNHKPGACCKVCGPSGSKGSGSGTTTQDLSGDSCPLMDSDGGSQEGGGNSEGGGGAEGGSGSEAGAGGAEGGAGSEGGYAFVEPHGSDRHHVVAVGLGVSTVIPFVWNDAAGIAPPADLWVEAEGRTVLQVSSEGAHPFARAGLDVVPLEPGRTYDLVIERSGDSLHVTLSSEGRESMLDVRAASSGPGADVVLPPASFRSAIVTSSL